jgi:hypothetical protein
VVIQALWPQEKLLLHQSAYRISSRTSEAVPVWVYNFSDAPVTGRLTVQAPKGWKASEFERIEVAPQSRAELRLELDCRDGTADDLGTVRVVGDFGAAGKPVLSLRLVPEPSLLVRQPGVPIAEADDPGHWQTTVSGGGAVKVSGADQTVLVEAEPLGPDTWVYEVLKLPAGQRPPPGAVGLACTLTLQEGEGLFRAIFDEANGSSYVGDFLPRARSGQPIEVLAAFDQVTYGAGWSKPDPNGRFDPAEVVSLKLGCNLKAGKVKFAFKNLRWVVR